MGWGRCAFEFEGTKRFEVLSQLGSGGMGVVYSAYDRVQRSQVALKTLKDHSPDALLRLKNEFRALQDLNHPNLVSLGELIEERGQWFFTMELINGVDFVTYVRGSSCNQPGSTAHDTQRSATLVSAEISDTLLQWSPSSQIIVEERDAQSIVSTKPILPPSFDEERLRAALLQLVCGLMALHAADRIHRDIKPSNILVTPDGRVVLLDFGLVTQPDQHASVHAQPVGTAAYMAPEQSGGEVVGPQVDWYALGVVIFQAVSGQLPFTGTALQIMYEKHQADPPRLRDVVLNVPEDLDSLCWDLMRYRTADRPTGAEVLHRLHRQQAGRSRSIVQAHQPFSQPVSSIGRSLFVGRQKEMVRLLQAFARVKEGRSSSVLVHGASGLGKSELLRTFAKEINQREPDAIVLSSRCYERESVPFKAFDGVMDALSNLLRHLPRNEVLSLSPRNVELLMRMFPTLGCVHALRRMPRSRRKEEDLQEIRSLAFKACQEMFARLADRYPVVVIIDDLQWVDEDSLLLLRSLLQGSDAPAICLLAAYRTSAPQESSSGLTLDKGSAPSMTLSTASAAFPPELDQLEIGPLHEDQARTLAAGILDLDDATAFSGQNVQSLAARIARESAGHPLFIHELARHAQTLGPRPPAEELRLDEALYARIAVLEPELHDLLEIVTVAGTPIRLSILAHALFLQPALLMRQVAQLRVLCLLRTSGSRLEDTVEPYHDRVRLAIQERIPLTKQRRWHEQLAYALEAVEHSGAEQLALHFELAGIPAKAAEYASEAAEKASGILAFDRAARLYRKALALWSSLPGDEFAEERRKLWVSLGDALANAGRGGRAASAYLEALRGANPTEKIELARQVADQLFRSGHIAKGMIATEQVLSSLGMKLPKTPKGTLLSLARGRLRLKLRGTGFRLQDEGSLSKEQLLRVDVSHSVALGMAMTDHIRGADFSTRFVHAALDAGEPSRVLVALALEANYVAASGRGRTRYFSKLISTAEQLLRHHKDPVARSYLEASKALGMYIAGQWSRTKKYAERAESIVSAARGGYTAERTIMHSLILWSLFYLGELHEMSKRVVPLVQDARDRGDLFSKAGMVLGLPNLAYVNMVGPDRARKEINKVMQIWRVSGYHVQHYQALLAEVHIDLYQGYGKRAYNRICWDWPNLKRSMLLYLPSIGNESRHLRACAALAAALVAPPTESKALLSIARKDARFLNRRKLAWTRALSLLLQAGIAAQRGDTAESIARLEASIVMLDKLKMRLYAAAARRRLGALIGGEAGIVHTAEGDAFMAQQHVQDPKRMTDLFAPGFP